MLQIMISLVFHRLQGGRRQGLVPLASLRHAAAGFFAVALGVVGVAGTTAKAGNNVAQTDAPMIDLSGEWQFQVDRRGVGIDEGWYDNDLPDTIKLPGTMRDQGFGDEVDADTDWWGGTLDYSDPMYAPFAKGEDFKSRSWLTPNLRYTGPAWYSKLVDVPANWQGSRVTLRLERPHIHSKVWVNGKEVGADNTLLAPHVFDVSDALVEGENRVTLLIDSSMDVNVGESSHSVTDHTQTPWNGVVGDIVLVQQDPIWIDDVQIHAPGNAKTVTVKATFGNKTGEAVEGRVELTIFDQNDNVVIARDIEASADVGMTQKTFEIELERPLATWDEFDPTLHTLQVSLGAGKETWRGRFGARTLEASGTEFKLNGRTIMFRGSLDCAIFPKTAYPPTDVESWKKIITAQQEHGLNHTRFHSWCPPRAAFIAADELGHYFQVECSTWCNGGTASVGEGHPIDEWLYDEGRRLIKEYGNHPSFVLLAAGNEPGGPERGAVYLSPWVDYFKNYDDRFMVTSGAGWPLVDESEFHNAYGPRLQGWGAGLNGTLNADKPDLMKDFRDYVQRYPNTPVISHETGQWCAWPNFAEMDKYTGSLKPKNFEIFKDLLEKRHQSDLYDDFLMASGALQVMAYKEEIERSLRTPEYGGFQLLGLQDFPGQGTAIVGVLDAFWEPKPYVSAEAYRQFCNETVILARMASRTFTAGDVVPVTLEISHYGRDDLKDATLRWSLEAEDGSIVAKDSAKLSLVPAGQLTRLIDTSLPTPSGKAQKLTLKTSLEGTDITNQWEMWVYPSGVETTAPDNVKVVRTLEEAEPLLAAGERVLLMVDPGMVATNVQIGFSPIFWNTSYTNNQAPHTMGTLVDPEHPALASFPTDFHGDWQWWDIMMNSATMELDHLPPTMRPVVQVVPDWVDPKRLALVAEVKVGDGRLLLCSIDLQTNISERLAAKQMLSSLLNYASGDDFDPEHAVSISDLKPIFRDPGSAAAMNATASASDSHPNYPAANVLDQNPDTIWHTNWQPTAPFPHDLTIDLQKVSKLRGVSALPRQDGPNGRIGEYEIYVSQDGRQWGEPVAKGAWAGDAKIKDVLFSTPVEGQFVRLRVLRAVNSYGISSLAEFDILLEESE